jgi:hypothetical protein
MNENQWPVPKYYVDQQPIFLFLVSPPYSGSTAIARLLNSAPKAMLLHPKGEGQWLIPGLCGKDRWQSSMPIQKKSIQAVWLHQYQKINRFVGTIDVVIEKSPPHMVRLDELLGLFNNTVVLANNRDPYANASSILYRSMKPENLSTAERIKALRSLAKHWLKRSKTIADIVTRLKVPLVTYESFCDEPSMAIRQLSICDDFKQTINVDATLKVKDYTEQKIVNQNPKQVQRLSSADIDAISSVLASDLDLLKFFDYALI